MKNKVSIKRILTYIIISLIVVIIIVTFLFNLQRNFCEVQDYYDNVENYIGDTVILNKDTLIVTDYDCVHNCFILHNNTRIDTDLVFKLKSNKYE